MVLFRKGGVVALGDCYVFLRSPSRGSRVYLMSAFHAAIILKNAITRKHHRQKGVRGTAAGSFTRTISGLLAEKTNFLIY